MPSCVGQRLLMRSAEPAPARPKATANLKTLSFCTTTRKRGWCGERPHSASVIHKVNYFIQLKTLLIFRNVIFELYEAAEGDILPDINY